VVAVRLPNGLPIVDLIHAAFEGDFILLPLNTRLSRVETEFQLRDSGTKFFLHEDKDGVANAVELDAAVNRVRVREESDELQAILEGPVSRGGSDSEPIRGFDLLDLDAVRAILYTSGTTGKPKGVVLSGANFLASARGSADRLGSKSSDRWLLCMPAFHVGGLSILLRSVLEGSAVILHEKFLPDVVNRDLDSRAITGISVVSNMLRRILDRRDEFRPPEALRCVLLGGGPAPDSLLLDAKIAGFPVAATYGLTEAASQVATCFPGEAIEEGLLPLPDTEVTIRDDADRILPVGRSGEICVRSRVVTSGYWNQPEATREILRDGWLHTGDIGMLNSHGRLVIHDRRSDLIVSGGENIYPAEVESALLEHPAIAEAGVSGRPDKIFGARPFAWLVAEGPDRPDAEALMEHCRARLAAFKCPAEFVWVVALPRTATGKLLRRKLGGAESDDVFLESDVQGAVCEME